MTRRLPRTGLLVVSLLASTTAVAQSAGGGERDEGERVYAIQQRRHLVGHEFAAGVGVLPIDAFFKGLTFSGSYTYHFNELFAWEAVQGIYTKAIATSLEDELETQHGLTSTSDASHELWSYALSSSAVIKPLYGKLALFNRTVIHVESFLVAGPSAGHFPSGFAPGGNVGAGLRFFPATWLSIRFDIRDYILRNAGKIENDLWIALSLGLNVNRNPGKP